MPRNLSLLSLILLIKAGTVLAAHGPGFIGCLQQSAYTPIANGAVINVADSAACATSCLNRPSPPPLYSYFNIDSGRCTCSDSQETLPSTGTAADTAGTCSAGQYSNCQSYGELLYRASSRQCFCFNAGGITFENNPPVACGLNTVSFFHYSHPAGSRASYGARRRADMNRLGETWVPLEGAPEVPDTAYCPRGMRPCMTELTSQSYECIDTDWELESCGGCINGAMNDVNRTSGMDCTTMPGVSVGGSTCSNGVCKAYRCNEGWRLKNGKCV
ncbi:hypothetical protein I302_105512 [Kwoniella bestiolae CBS 10118]|uniref:Protein CPL1-like domain-containing protein n=1 Tax=Kwoniella bestiolae CBS 10118 TaxID=1296100 RepID=A0A1B9FTB9_9TREE|nr:hypothetical protein I302_08793 [Kwoniella bestiolae CBS 10118]OCF22012.1 hypothetical protein I302_08793 [Kwoniella bestiolae CBS 10118]